MQRFVSRRPSSSVDLGSSSLDDVRTERAAIAMSVGLSWPPVKRRRSAGRRSWQQLWERALQKHILHHHEVPRGVRLQRPDWWRPGGAIARPLTHEKIAHTRTPCAASAAALVEDEPSGSGTKRRNIHVPVVCDWFLDMLDQWKAERRWSMQRCLGEVWRLCPGMFDGINQNTPHRWKRSAPAEAPLGRKTLLSPAGMTHPASVRRPVPECGHDPRLGARMARRRGTRRASRSKVGQTAPARHATELQEARPVRDRTPQL